MTEPLTFDPYPCAFCGIRLQWVVSFAEDRSQLSIIEFDTSQPHHCRRKPRPRPLRPIVDPVATALAGVEAAQREATAAIKAQMGELLRISDNATEALIATDSILAQLKPSAPNRSSYSGDIEV